MFYTVGDRVVMPSNAGDGLTVLEPFKPRDAVVKALLYLAYSKFSALLSLVENSHLYHLEDDELENWLEVTKYQLIKERLHVVFPEVRLRVMEVLNVNGHKASLLIWL